MDHNKLWKILKEMGILDHLGFPGGSAGKECACNAGDLDSISGSGRPLEKEMGTHASTVAWGISWTEEPGRLQSMGSQDSDTTERLSTHTHTLFHIRF